MADSNVRLELTDDQALVFFDWLAQFNELEGREFAHPAEKQLLFDLEAQLESLLSEPLCKDYAERVQQARDALTNEGSSG